MDGVNPATIQRMWVITLVVYGVVLLVVAALLTLILRAARDIRTGLSAIWTAGQQVANNTIHIALLDTTVHVTDEILECARGIIASTRRLNAHAERCAECPTCGAAGQRAR
jgi:hypothetical protein